MEYNHKLLRAEVVGVYNNLIVDVRLENGETTAAFCGAEEIAGMCKQGTILELKRTSRPKRLIKYNVAFVHTPEGVVFANPRYSRQLFQEAFAKGILNDFADYPRCRLLPHSENICGLDFELTGSDKRKCFVAVVPVYNKQNGCAVFPYSINFFEMRMIEEMKRRQQGGAETCLFLLVPREDCLQARFVWNINPRAAGTLFEAVKNGLNVVCYGCKRTKTE